MNPLLAHSAEYKKHYGDEIIIPAQSYQDHVNGVRSYALKLLAEKKQYLNVDEETYSAMENILSLACTYHDMGKLDDQCQRVLRTPPDASRDGHTKQRMINHVDAGCAFLINCYDKYNESQYIMAAFIVLAHHIGFDDFSSVVQIDMSRFRPRFSYDLDSLRDDSSMAKYMMGNSRVRDHVDTYMKSYSYKHEKYFKFEHVPVNNKIVDTTLKSFLMFRFLLSLLIDADHKDTSENYKSYYPVQTHDLKPEERLKSFNTKLDEVLGQKTKDLRVEDKPFVKRRNDLRNKMREEVNAFEPDPQDMFYLVKGLVGSGKTFSYIPLALKIAEKSGLNKLIINIPYIALVDQSYGSLDDLVFMEDKDKEINAIHSLFDYERYTNKIYAKGVTAPINIATSKTFFDIFTSNSPSVIRNFHKIVGAVIVFDEYDRCAELQHWGLIYDLLYDLGCLFGSKFVLGSGSPPSYWELEDLQTRSLLSDKTWEIVNVLSDSLYNQMLTLESDRVKYDYHTLYRREQSFQSLTDAIIQKEGSVFVVMSTVLRTVEFAKFLKENTDKSVFVRHSSVNHSDKQEQYRRVSEALNDGEDVILVATDGSDIGLDLSFRYGFREEPSYRSVLQMAGRVNRGFEYTDSMLYVFKLSDYPLNDDKKFGRNFSLKPSQKAYEWNLKSVGNHSPENCTYMMEKEFEYRLRSGKDNIKDDIRAYKDSYQKLNFRTLDEIFQIIPSIQVCLITDLGLVQKIEDGEYVSYADVQRASVNKFLSEKKLEELVSRQRVISVGDLIIEDGSIQVDGDRKKKLRERQLEILVWMGDYDDEFGIMADEIW